MSTIEPAGRAAMASWNCFTGLDAPSGTPIGFRSGPITSTPTMRNSQRRSSFSSQSSFMTLRPPPLIAAPQVRALDAKDHAQAGGHDAERRAHQHRALRRVLRHIHDPVLDGAKPHGLGEPRGHLVADRYAPEHD